MGRIPYAIMSNHFHLAIEALTTRELSAYVGSVCSLYSRYWHRHNGGGRGTIWQGRYKSIPVQMEGYMARLGRYIERNPVVAGIEGGGETMGLWLVFRQGLRGSRQGSACDEWT